MSKVLISPSNEVWLKSNKVLKERPFENVTLPTNKVAEFIGGDFENVDGKVAIWYDSVGSADMVQATETNRLAVTNLGGIDCVLATTSQHLNWTNPVFRSFFIVFYHRAINNCMFEGSGPTTGWNSGVSALLIATGAFAGVAPSKFYVNGQPYTLNTVKANNNWYVVYCEYMSNISSGARVLFNNTTFVVSFRKETAHLVFYTDILNAQDIEYNSNALMTKYGII